MRLWISLLCTAALLGVILPIAWRVGYWDDVAFWTEANKYGIIFTILGTAFSVITFFYLTNIRKQLKRKYRIPETHLRISEIIPQIREGLKDWDSNKDDIVGLFHDIRGHLESVASKLDGAERSHAMSLAAQISRSGLRYIFRREIDQQLGWYLHGELRTFAVKLDNINRDNEAGRI